MSEEIIDDLINEAWNHGIDNEFFNRNSLILKQAKITQEEFIGKYNDYFLTLVNLVEKTLINSKFYAEMSEMDMRVPSRINSVLEYMFRPNEDFLTKVVEIFEKLFVHHAYLKHVLIQEPFDGFWRNHIQYHLISDRNVAIKRLIDIGNNNRYPFYDGYMDYSTGRFGGLINYLYEHGYQKLFDRMINAICYMINNDGCDMVFVIVCLLNFLKEKNNEWYGKVYRIYQRAIQQFDGTNWNDSLWFLCGVERYSLKSATKNLTIEEALKL